MKAKRISSIEIGRVAAVFAVICLHTRPFYDWPGTDSGRFIYFLIDSFCRFAVPFFFMASGYFFAKSYVEGAAPGKLLGKYISRIGIWLLVWSLIYAVLPDDFFWMTLRHGPQEGLWEGGKTQWLETARFLSDSPVSFFLESTAIHLWFLISLMMSLMVLAIFLKIKKISWGVGLGFILLVLAFLMKPYQLTPLGIRIPGIPDGKDGPFFSTFFVMAGAWLAAHPRAWNSWHAFGLALGGYGLSLIEVYSLRQIYHLPWMQDFVVGTVFMALGLFVLALNHPDWGSRIRLGALGRYTLGIYLSHIVVWEVIWNLNKYVPPVFWQFLFPILIFIAALAGTAALQQVPGLKKAVS